MDSLLHTILLSVNLVNLVIILLLLYVYSKNYRHIRSKYNLGLMIFSLMFLVETVLILHLGIYQWPAIIDDIILLHMAVINAIQTLGLFSLLYITWK